MAILPHPGVLTAARAALGLLLGAAAAPAAAPLALSPEQASARRPGDFAAVHQGESVRVRGRISSIPVRIRQRYDHVGLERDGYGLMLESPDARLRSLRPGDDVEAAGQIAIQGGLPVLRVSEVRVLGHGAAPEPLAIPPDQLQGFRHLGRLVVTEGRVVEAGENTAGAYLLIGDADAPYKIFLPYETSGRVTGTFRAGDTIRAIGVASQYGPSPPYNRLFQLTVARPEDVVRTGHPLVLPSSLVVGFVAAALLAGIIWWIRERRLGAQREALRRCHELGEEILGASSAQDMFKKTTAVLPSIFGITRVHLYIYNAGTKMLEKVPENEEEGPRTVAMAEPHGTDAGVAACFQNRVALTVPDTARSPFPPPGPGHPPMPRSVLFVPMLAQGETVGVFEISHQDRVREFSPDEQALAQHLANQIGVALRLLDRRSVREQLFRTEKLAAVGRLISGVVNELQAPLASICNHAEQALATHLPEGRTWEQVKAISVEARKASDMVARLVSFASNEPVEARPVELNALLRHMAEFREREWKARGIRVRAVMADEPLPVLGSEGQLEQVLLDLIVNAEQALADVPDKMITLRTMRLARRALVEISFTGRRGEEPPADADAALGIGVCRGIIAGHGGELRALYPANAEPRFEIEMPLAYRDRQAAAPREEQPRDTSLPLTALVIEPDESMERHLLALLTSRGYRVVPVHNSDTGLDLAQRMRFEIAFCSVRAPGLNWVELSESLQTRVGGFVLLSDGHDPELAADFEGEGRFVLPKPIDEARLDHVLERVLVPVKPRTAVG